MTRPWALRRPPRDFVAAAGGAFVFSVGLGLASVALPLLALQSGFSGAGVGVLIAVSAAAQMLSRMVLGPLMRILPDWTLVVTAGAVLAMSNALVVMSAAVLPFVIAELLQGVARACFWTGSQTHVVRGPGSSVAALAAVSFTSGVGLFFGPLLGGALAEHSLQAALGVGAAIAATSCVPSLFLRRLPPFSRPAGRPEGMLWRRPGVSAGCWAGLTSGGWRGLLGSYVPVVLSEARQSSSTIGTLVAVANASALLGSGVVGRLRHAGMAPVFTVGALVAGLSTAAVGWSAGSPWAAAVALAASGVGAGALQTLGPAVASDAVHPEERGEAIAVAGTFRSAALLFAPLGVAGLLAVVPLAAAMGVAGVLMTLPALTVRGLSRHLSPAEHT